MNKTKLKWNQFSKITFVTVEVFVGDSFDTADSFETLGLSNVDVVFGLLNAVERAVDATGADLTRDAADAVADVVVFVALTLDVAVVLVAGFVKGLNKNQS